MFRRVKEWIALLAGKERFALFVSKGLVYWISVFILVVTGVLVGSLLEEKNTYLASNYWIYWQMDRAIPGDPTVNDIVLVLIGDDEYWTGELGHRVPIKRDYLAELVRAIAKGNPAAIALDFDLRSPVPDGSMIEHPDYEEEKNQFLQAVKEMASVCPIVLPRTVVQDSHGQFISESDIHKGFRWGSAEKSIYLGYIFHDEDMRLLPVRRALKGEPPADSFVQAIIRASKPSALPTIQRFEGDRSPPYGRYLPKKKFPWISAGDILRGDPSFLKDKLAHKIVIAGGAWSQTVYGDRSKADEHLTPVGLLPGVFIHANHVQAILCDRVHRRFPEIVVRLGEGALSFLVAVIFVLVKSWKKVLWVLVIVLLLVGANYFLLVNFGQYFDVLAPLIIVTGHSIYEHLRGRKAPRQEPC